MENNLQIWLQQILSLYVSEEVVLSFEDSRYCLSYQGSQKKIYLPISKEFYNTGLQQLSCSVFNLSNIDIPNLDLSVPAPAISHSAQLISTNKDSYTFNYDVLGLAFWMLSRAEEVDNKNFDNHERFSAKHSNAYENNYLHRPIVDEWFINLEKLVSHVWPNVELSDKKFQTIPTHDVDEPSRYGFKSWKRILKIIIKDIIYEKSLRSIFVSSLVKMRTKTSLSALDPYNVFDWLMKESETIGVKSHFYFIPKKNCSIRDADYDLNHKAIINLMIEINDREHHIGVHPSYYCYNDLERLSDEITHLKNTLSENNVIQKEFGSRMHYLRWNTPQTLDYLNQNKVMYDTTLGYADVPGFRCGTCREYPAINPVTKEIYDIKIRPLIAMEFSIIGEPYLNLGNGDKALDKFLELKNQCKKVKGNFVFLWHNSRLDMQSDRDLYEKILKL